jgi:hypothetical protein
MWMHDYNDLLRFQKVKQWQDAQEDMLKAKPVN